MVSLSSTRPDSMATYSCMLGYMLTGGDRERRCQGNGTWDGTEPTCTGERTEQRSSQRTLRHTQVMVDLKSAGCVASISI